MYQLLIYVLHNTNSSICIVCNTCNLFLVFINFNSFNRNKKNHQFCPMLRIVTITSIIILF